MSVLDPFSKQKRSEVMSKIRGHDNITTELYFRKLLKKFKIKGWRRHGRHLPGTPDFYFLKQRVAVFLDGCFWHGCPTCTKGRLPVNNAAFWKQKLLMNKTRDRRFSRELRQMSWKVLRIWEHKLKGQDKTIAAAVWRILEA